TPKGCDDGDACNGIESCDPSSGTCVSTPTFFVARSARVGTSAKIGGNVGGNDDVSSIRLGRLATMADGTSLTANSVRLGHGASAFDVFANQLRKGPDAVVRGITGPATLPLTPSFCPVPAFACGGPDVVVSGSTSGPLAAGTYGNLEVQAGA